MSDLMFFERKQVRRAWHGDAWWFVIVDAVVALTDSGNPSGYLRNIRRRDPSLAELFKGGGQFDPPLAPKIAIADWRQKILCGLTEGILRLIQSLPLPKIGKVAEWQRSLLHQASRGQA